MDLRIAANSKDLFEIKYANIYVSIYFVLDCYDRNLDSLGESYVNLDLPPPFSNGWMD